MRNELVLPVCRSSWLSQKQIHLELSSPDTIV